MPITYHTLPVPAFEEYTTRIPAGAVTFGVEYRKLDETVILEFYGPDARSQFDGVTPAGMEGTVDEDGLCLHVFGTADGEEYLRFDCFEVAAHYHLLDPRAPRNVVIEHDVERKGPLLDWAIETLRARLPELLAETGASDLSTTVDPAHVARALDAVKTEAERALAAGAPVRSASRP